MSIDEASTLKPAPEVSSAGGYVRRISCGSYEDRPTDVRWQLPRQKLSIGACVLAVGLPDRRRVCGGCDGCRDRWHTLVIGRSRLERCLVRCGCWWSWSAWHAPDEPEWSSPMAGRRYPQGLRTAGGHWYDRSLRTVSPRRAVGRHAEHGGHELQQLQSSVEGPTLDQVESDVRVVVVDPLPGRWCR